jgi:chromate transporter
MHDSHHAPPAGAHPSRAEAFRVWLRVALYSFGGPAGQIAVMQRILVDEKRWIGQHRFLHALNFCMLLPGPEAQQLATYLGWLLHRWRGALVAGTLFVLPGFIAILGLTILYVEFRSLPAVEGVFFGIKPAVLAIVVHALLRIGRRALATRALVAVAAGAFLAIFAFGVPFPLIIAGAALLAFAGDRIRPGAFAAVAPVTAGAAGAPGAPGAAGARRAAVAPGYVLDDAPAAGERPRLRRLVATAALWLAIWWLPVALLAAGFGVPHVLIDEAIFFSKAAVVTFGGAYAVLAYIAQQAVEAYHWLQPGEMLDGLGMAETTPGPLIQVVQFVGFLGAYREPGALPPLGAGLLGAVVTTWVTFVPCFLWILAGAPYVEYLRGRRVLGAALAAITAAVVGVILNLSLWFAAHTLFAATRTITDFGLRLEVPVAATLDTAAAVIALLAFFVLFVLRRGIFATIGAAAAAGLVWRVLT